MGELTTYRKILLKKKLKRLNDFFDEKDNIVASKNIVALYLWKGIKVFLKAFFGICLYGEYLLWKFKDFTFDAGFMDYQIQTRGMTPEEAVKYLTEQKIKLKEYIYRIVVSDNQISKAEKSFDYLFTKYEALAEHKIKPYVSKQHPDWMNTVWQNLIEKRCVLQESKSDFVLAMMNNNPVQKIIWCKGLIKLVQFVEEAIEIEKISIQSFLGKDKFIQDYIASNFRPNPNIPNQKLEQYTEERIKNAQNEFLKIRPKDRVKEFFVFDDF